MTYKCFQMNDHYYGMLITSRNYMIVYKILVLKS